MPNLIFAPKVQRSEDDKRGSVYPRHAAVDEGLPPRSSASIAQSILGVPPRKPDPTRMQRIVKSFAFKAFMDLVICVNAVLLGVAVELNNPDHDEVFDICDHIFTAIYLAETLLVLGSYGRAYFRDLWNVFDFVVVTVSIIEAWVMPLVAGRTDASFQKFRLMRLARLLKVIKIVPELRMVITGIGSSMSAMGWVVVLLSVVLYTWSIYCVQVIGAKDVGYKGYNNDDEYIRTQTVKSWNNFVYFGNLPRAMFSLFGVILLTEWPSIIRPVWEVKPVLVPLFVCLVVLTSFGVLNVIIGVIVEKTSAAMGQLRLTHLTARRQDQMKMVTQLADILYSLDQDHDDALSIEEFERAKENPAMLDMLSRIKFPHGFTFRDLHLMLDSDGSGTVSKRELLVGMLRLIFCTTFQRDCMLQFSMAVGKQNLATLHKQLRDELTLAHDEVLKLERLTMDDQRPLVGSGTGIQTPSPSRCVSAGHTPDLKSDLHEGADSPGGGDAAAGVPGPRLAVASACNAPDAVAGRASAAHDGTDSGVTEVPPKTTQSVLGNSKWASGIKATVEAALQGLQPRASTPQPSEQAGRVESGVAGAPGIGSTNVETRSISKDSQAQSSDQGSPSRPPLSKKLTVSSMGSIGSRRIKISLGLNWATTLVPVSKVCKDQTSTSDATEVINAVMKREMVNQEDMERQRNWKHKFAEHLVLRASVSFCIFANAIQMGLAAEFANRDIGDLSDVWWYCDHLFCAVFAFEMVVKLWAYELLYFKDVWNIFDFLICWISIVDMWVISVVPKIRDSVDAGNLKIFRLLRLLRMWKLVKMLPEVMMIIEGMVSSLKAMFWVFMLLVLIMYTLAIYCVDELGREESGFPAFDADSREIAEADLDNWNSFEHFGTLGRSTITLFGIILLSEWSGQLRAIFEEQTAVIWMFIFLVILTSFGILNVIIGVIVEKTNDMMNQVRKAELRREQQRQCDTIGQLADILFELDQDLDEQLSVEELESGRENDHFLDLFKQVELPHGFTFRDVHSMLDEDGSGRISKFEFVCGMLRLVYCDDLQRGCLFQLLAGQTRRRITIIHQDLQDLMQKFRAQQMKVYEALRDSNGLDAGSAAPCDPLPCTLESPSLSDKPEFSGRKGDVPQRRSYKWKCPPPNAIDGEALDEGSHPRFGSDTAGDKTEALTRLLRFIEEQPPEAALDPEGWKRRQDAAAVPAEQQVQALLAEVVAMRRSRDEVAESARAFLESDLQQHSRTNVVDQAPAAPPVERPPDPPVVVSRSPGVTEVCL